MNKFVAGAAATFAFFMWTGYIHREGEKAGYKKAADVMKFANKVTEIVTKKEEEEA